MFCDWCGETLKFTPERGYVHQQGGAYMMTCPACGWRGAPYPPPVKCPHCGSSQVGDKHAALPVPRLR